MEVKEIINNIPIEYGTKVKLNVDIDNVIRKTSLPEYPQLHYIPYQLCPKCLGEGYCFSHNITTSIARSCPVCEGKRIIPMYQIK